MATEKSLADGRALRLGAFLVFGVWRLGFRRTASRRISNPLGWSLVFGVWDFSLPLSPVQNAERLSTLQGEFIFRLLAFSVARRE